MSEGKTEAGGTEVGDRWEEFYSKGHSNGMQNPKFGRSDSRKLEFKSYLSEKIIRCTLELLR